MTLELSYANGQLAALERYKLGWPAPTNPTVANSAVLRSKAAPSTLPPEVHAGMQPPTTPHQLAQIFDGHEQVQSRTEPLRKLSADICTTCRKAKHYGSCNQPRAIPAKTANFNSGMLGSDPSQGDNPSTSPHYHSATTADSALARSRDGRPADEQAATGFADLFRHLGISNAADEPGRMYGGLNKVAGPESFKKKSALGPSALAYFRKSMPQVTPTAPHSQGIAFVDKHQYRMKGIPQNFRADAPVAREMPNPAAARPVGGPSSKVVVDPSLYRTAAHKLADFMLSGTEGHSMHEQRGPSVNPYEERKTRRAPPVGWGDEGKQRIDRMFREFDNPVDTTNIGGGFGDPQPGPAVLG